MILINGVVDNRIEISDRGLQYGDGLFETLAYRNGRIELVDAHFSRLIEGCQRLAIPFSQIELLKAELNSIVSELDADSVIKIIITRGSGGRGYFADQQAQVTRIISTHTYPSYPEHYQHQGITVRFCSHQLSENAYLAGLKHLNRLDQVLARNEWHDTTIAEGLMKDQHDNVIEGTMTNLFIIKSAVLITADLSLSGVSGIMRAKIIDLASQHNIELSYASFNQHDVLAADEVFVCNSINRIWPVKMISGDDKHYAVGPITRQLQQLLSEEDL